MSGTQGRADRARRRKPTPGVSTPAQQGWRSVNTGARNGWPEGSTYRWRPGDAERDAQVAARLAQARELAAQRAAQREALGEEGQGNV